MLHRELIRSICNKYHVGNDVADIIQNYVIYLYCPALYIKQELFKYVNHVIESYDPSNTYLDYWGYHGFGYSIMRRNIAGSYFKLPGKENLVDHAFDVCKHAKTNRFGYPGDAFHEFSLIHDFDYEYMRDFYEK